MPSANRYFLPGYIWHITHRCHKQAFLLKFIKHRENWMHWLFEAKKRYGLCVLNYMVTSNHIHLFVKDQWKEEISRSMQLIAGRAALHPHKEQEMRLLGRSLSCNSCWFRWIPCPLHDLYWPEYGARLCGCWEIRHPPRRYRVIDREALCAAFDIDDYGRLQKLQKERVETAMRKARLSCENCWTEAVALGGCEYLEKIKSRYGVKCLARSVFAENSLYMLKEERNSYSAVPLLKSSL